MATNVDSWVRSLDRALKKAGTPERAEGEKKYLKSDLVHYGVKVPEIRKLARRFDKEHHPNIPELLNLTDRLWDQGVFEARSISGVLLTHRADELTVDHLPRIEGWLRRAHTWALVDLIAISAVGPIVNGPRGTRGARVLNRWSKDEDFWIRRSAMLALLLPIRAGGGDFDRFGRYADRMLEEREFFIRKAIGWVLREASKKRPQLVFDWLAPRAHRASGVTMREAVKYLSDTQQKALKARSSR